MAALSISVASFGADLAAAADPPVEVSASAHSMSAVAEVAQQLGSGDRLSLEGVGVIQSGIRTEVLGLDLQRFEVFSDDAVVVVHGDDGTENRPVVSNVQLQGTIAGEPDSLAWLSVSDAGQIRGLLRRSSALWVLTDAASPPGSTDPGLAAIAVEEVTDDPADGFRCDQEKLASLDSFAALDHEAVRLSDSVAAAVSNRTARVAVETDYELYLRFGNVADLSRYVGDLFGFASAMYDDEIGTNLVVSHLSTWSTSSDPWTQSSSLCTLFQFGRYWNDNRQGVSRTIAHFLSGKQTGGGVAWVGVLCSGSFFVDRGTSCGGLSPQIDNYGGAYGFTGNIRGDFNITNPNQVWDIIATSHEVGHNFNSPHTHCYNGLGGSSSPVDKCYNLQAGCWSGSASLPGPAGQSSGTIMSYCHLTPPGYTNVALTMGTDHPYGTLPNRVPDRMRAHVDAQANSNPSCLARYGGDGGGGGPCNESIQLSNRTVTGAEQHTSCGTITAGNGYAIASTGDVALQAVEVVLGSGFSVQAGGSLTVRTQ